MLSSLHSSRPCLQGLQRSDTPSVIRIRGSPSRFRADPLPRGPEPCAEPDIPGIISSLPPLPQKWVWPYRGSTEIRLNSSGNPWYFAVRPGTPADQKLFGGDSRLLSRDGFTSTEAMAFAKALSEVEGEVVRTLKSRPELAVLFQHDLLRVAERLMETGRNPELLRPITTVVKKVALASRQLSQLPSTYELGLKFGSIDSNLPSNLLRGEPPVEGPLCRVSPSVH